MNRYALWLSPAAEAFGRWRVLIDSLGARLGTPAFEPHVTLLAGLFGAETQLREALRALALDLEPFDARLLEIKQLDEYYRCVFVEIEMSRMLQYGYDAALRRCHAPPPSARFYPHLSLVYGDLPAARKRELIETLGSRVDESLRLTHLALIEVPDGPTTWRCIERAVLGGDDNTI